MAIAQVQKKIGSLASDGTSITVSFDSAPTEGNLLIATISLRGNSSGPTWPSGWIEAWNAIDNTISALAYKTAGASESSDVAPTWSNSAGAVLAIAEYSGIETTPLDKTATNTGSGTSLSTGTTSSTAEADELLIAAVAIRLDHGGWNTWTNSFTHQDDDESTSASVAGLGWAHRIVSSTGAYETTGSWTNSRDASAGIATFKASGAVAGDWPELERNVPRGVGRGLMAGVL